MNILCIQFRSYCFLEAKAQVREVIEGYFTPEKFDRHLAETHNKYNYRTPLEQAAGITRLRYPPVKNEKTDLCGFNVFTTRSTARTVKVCIFCLGVSRDFKDKELKEHQYVTKKDEVFFCLLTFLYGVLLAS